MRIVPLDDTEARINRRDENYMCDSGEILSPAGGERRFAAGLSALFIGLNGDIVLDVGHTRNCACDIRSLGFAVN